MCDLVIDPTQLNREYLTVRWPFTTWPSCPLKQYRLMPAPYRIADVIDTIATYYMVFSGRQDV
jgi:hypothetical protein